MKPMLLEVLLVWLACALLVVYSVERKRRRRDSARNDHAVR